MEVVSEEGDGVVGSADTKAHDGILQNLLDIVALHVRLTLSKGLLFFKVRRHLHSSRTDGNL